MTACFAWLCLAAAQPLDSLPMPAPIPATLSPAPVRPVTLGEFAATFRPAPGNYEVVFLHPDKCCPVKVCFTLPCGCPKVKVCKRMLVFDYGRHCVRIRFKLIGGGVVVSSH